MSVELVPAASVDFSAFTAALNRAYADYFVPLNMTIDELRTRVAQDDIRLDLSCAAVEDGRVVGVAMMARRGSRGWIGGVGVIPVARGRGIGRAIMEYLLREARTDGIEEVHLEVITANKRARALYDSLGFYETRLLHLVEGAPGNPRPNPTYRYRTAPAGQALRYHDAFHPVQQPWQRDLKALRAMALQLDGVISLRDGEIVAYAVGVFREYAISFADLAAMPTEHDGIDALRGLVAFLHAKYPGAQGRIINLSAEDPAWPVLQSMGYQPYLSQHEMAYRLRP